MDDYDHHDQRVAHLVQLFLQLGLPCLCSGAQLGQLGLHGSQGLLHALMLCQVDLAILLLQLLGTLLPLLRTLARLAQDTMVWDNDEPHVSNRASVSHHTITNGSLLVEIARTTLISSE